MPGYVDDELRGYLECGLLCFGFARARCKLVQVHDDRDIFQASPQELPAIEELAALAGGTMPARRKGSRA